ncbi:MAG: hypothetical protein Q7J73_04020 [Dehalococcoidales bacterium]|nr:hypothetical protein [Dehalococcoidales bacterium]
MLDADPWYLSYRCRDSGKTDKGSALVWICIKAVSALFEHSALVAGDHDHALPIHTRAVMFHASLFDLETSGSDTLHTGAIGLGCGSLLVGDGDVLLELGPACVLTHVDTSCFVDARSRPGSFRAATWSEKDKGVSLEPFRSKLLTPFL